MKKLLLIALLIVGCEELLESIKEGCTTSTACNYDTTATKDDGSCILSQGCNEWCEGNSLSVQELDCAGVCGGDAVLSGCDNACNSTAVVDECGVCDTDSSNNCTQDCAGTWGGNAALDDCALSFSLEVIEAFINQDVETFKTFFTDYVYTLEDGDDAYQISENEITEMFNQILNNSQIDENTTMDDFHANHTSAMYTYDEVVELWGDLGITWFTSDVYLYFGKLVEGGTNIIWEDALIFCVIQIDNVWKLIGLSG